MTKITVEDIFLELYFGSLKREKDFYRGQEFLTVVPAYPWYHGASHEMCFHTSWAT